MILDRIYENRFISLTDNDIELMASSIQNVGYVCLEGVFSQGEMDEASRQVRSLVEASGGEYAGREGNDELEGIILHELSSSQAFLQLCQGLCLHQGIKVASGAPVKQILRCLSGSSALEHCFYFHFDSFELTALVPIVIPQGDRAGDLIMFPNARRRRRSYVLNAIDKALLEKAGGQTRARRRASRPDAALRVKLQPGNLYFFNGNRSLHANDDTDPQAIRATLLIHFGGTHHDHWLRRIRAVQKFRATA